MKILKSILYTAFALLIYAEIIYTQDFKIAPNLIVPEGSDFYNVSVASDPDNGFLVTWVNLYTVDAINYRHNYACRISNTGEMLDTTAIFLCASYWAYCVPSAVFLGGNWIIAVNRGGLAESVGALRLTSSGEVLDSIPVEILPSTGAATIVYPTIATNGQEILCVTEIAGEGLYGSIFDSDLNILVEKFLIYAGAAGEPYRVTSNGDNFFITWLNWQSFDTDDRGLKLAIVNPQGDILSIQTVKDEWTLFYKGSPTITTLNDTTYITYFDYSKFWIRRYSSAGNPIDSSGVKIFESPDFYKILDGINWGNISTAYLDLVWANEYFRFFWPGVSDPGISMWSFKPDLSTGNNQPTLLNSQCQIQQRYGFNEFWKSLSIIRASSIGNTVLTAWIDGREGNEGRVYGNFFDVSAITGIDKIENMIPADFSISHNYPNPFNPTTKIRYSVPHLSKVIIKVFDILGNEIETLVNEEKPTGNYEVEFDASNLSSGVYFYQLQAGDFLDTKKMVLLK